MSGENEGVEMVPHQETPTTEEHHEGHGGEHHKAEHGWKHLAESTKAILKEKSKNEHGPTGRAHPAESSSEVDTTDWDELQDYYEKKLKEESQEK